MTNHTPEPAVMIKPRQNPQWNPNYTGPYQGEFYAAQDFAAVTSQRDELLKALEGIIDFDKRHVGNPTTDEMIKYWEHEKNNGTEREMAETQLAALYAIAKCEAKP